MTFLEAIQSCSTAKQFADLIHTAHMKQVGCGREIVRHSSYGGSVDISVLVEKLLVLAENEQESAVRLSSAKYEITSLNIKKIEGCIITRILVAIRNFFFNNWRKKLEQFDPSERLESYEAAAISRQIMSFDPTNGYTQNPNLNMSVGTMRPPSLQHHSLDHLDLADARCEAAPSMTTSAIPLYGKLPVIKINA